mmetsp:Transcript_13615/g.39227  ORF Transcript_13615/g.39227 Transcript_13615/m.39227 type:complete len:227 (-) Transcript_13615:522-1202(-)
MMSNLPLLKKSRISWRKMVGCMPPWITVGLSRIFPNHRSHSSAQFPQSDVGQTTATLRHMGLEAGRLSAAQMRHKACSVFPRPMLSARMQPAPARMWRSMKRTPSTWCGFKCLHNPGSKKTPSPASGNAPGGGANAAVGASSWPAVGSSMIDLNRFGLPGEDLLGAALPDATVVCAKAFPEVKSAKGIAAKTSTILSRESSISLPGGNASLTRTVRGSIRRLPSSL